MWRTGLNLGYAGFTVGGSYMRADATNGSDVGSGTSTDGYYFDLGATYATGPYKVGVTWAHSESAGAVTGNGNANEDEIDWIVVGGTYTLGPGISLTGDIIFADYSDETTALANNNDGFAVNAGVVVAF